MPGPVRLIPHREGPWLLYVERRCFAIEPAVGQRLRQQSAKEGVDEHLLAAVEDLDRLTSMLDQIPAGERVGRERRAIWPRLTLLSAQVIVPAARSLAGLASWRMLGAMVAIGLSAGAVGWAGGAAIQVLSVATPGSLTAGLLLLLGTALWHELGHAAALYREGYPPGRVGCGWLLLFPVLFCDVTPVGALPRRGRLRVDCAGVAFQAAAGGLLFCAGSLAPTAGLAGALSTAACLAGLSAAAAVCWSLLPFLRSDGYWLLCDLLDLPDLESPWTTGSAVGSVRSPRWLIWLLINYRLANLIFLLLVSLWLPRRLLRFVPLAEWWAAAGAKRVLACGLGILILTGCAWLWGSAGRRMLTLGSACAADVRLLRGNRS